MRRAAEERACHSTITCQHLRLPRNNKRSRTGRLQHAARRADCGFYENPGLYRPRRSHQFSVQSTPNASPSVCDELLRFAPFYIESPHDFEDDHQFVGLTVPLPTTVKRLTTLASMAPQKF